MEKDDKKVTPENERIGGKTDQRVVGGNERRSGGYDIDALTTLSNIQTHTFQMRPSIDETFRGVKIKGIITTVLGETLKGKVYNAEEAKKWTKQIADTVNSLVMELQMPKYKHVVQVTLGQQLGAGCRYIAKCCWDADSDSQISDLFHNSSFFCICTVFGIFLY